MSKKDVLIKLVDEKLNEIKFYRNLLVSIIAGILGIIIGISQNKIIFNSTIEIILILGIITAIINFILYIISKIKLNKILKQLEKEKEC